MSSQYLSLSRHPKQYSFSFGDAGFTLLTGFSGVTYARRHWDMSRSERVWGHRTIALLEFIPVIGGVAALVERIAVYISHYFQGAVRFTSQIPAEDLAAFCSRCSTRDLLDFSRANRRVRVIALRELESRFMLDLPTHIPEQRLGAELKDTIEKLRLHFQPDDANPVNNQFPGLTQLLGYIPKWVPPEPNHYSLYNVFQLRSRELLQHLLAKEPPIRYHLVLCRDLLLNQQFRMADYVICYVSSVCSKEEILKSLISSALRSGNMTIVEKLEDAAGRDIVQICYISEQCNIISEADESNNEAIQQHVITIFKELGRRLQLNPDLIPIIDRLKSENFRKIILESALQLDCDPAKALKAAYSTNNVSYIERWRNKFELQNNFHPMELSYACSAGSEETVAHAISKIIDKSKCDIAAASATACGIGSPIPVIRLLLNNGLFQSPQPSYIKDLIRIAKSAEDDSLKMLVELFLEHHVQSGLLEAAYATGDLALIQQARARFDLKSQPDPNELTYACLTDNFDIVKYAVEGVDRSKTDIEEASKIAWHNEAVLDLLIKNRLFKLTDPVSIEEFFKANLQHPCDLTPGVWREFLACIDTIHPEDRTHIMASTCYKDAKRALQAR